MIANGGKATFTLPDLMAEGPDDDMLPADAVLEFRPEGGAFVLLVVLQLLPRRRLGTATEEPDVESQAQAG